MTEINRLNKVLETAIKSNGLETVITWVSLIEKSDFSNKDIIFFRKVKKETLKSLNIRFLKQNDPTSTDAKIIITKICETYTKLKIRQIANQLNVSEQSIFYYKTVFQNRIKLQKSFEDFNEKYKLILKKVQQNDNNR